MDSFVNVQSSEVQSLKLEVALFVLTIWDDPPIPSKDIHQCTNGDKEEQIQELDGGGDQHKAGVPFESNSRHSQQTRTESNLLPPDVRQCARVRQQGTTGRHLQSAGNERL